MIKPRPESISPNIVAVVKIIAIPNNEIEIPKRDKRIINLPFFVKINIDYSINFCQIVPKAVCRGHIVHKQPTANPHSNEWGRIVT